MKKEFKSPRSRVIDVQAVNLMQSSGSAGQTITGEGTASFSSAAAGTSGEYADSKGFTGGFFWE